MDPQIVLRRLVEMSGGPAERGYVLALASPGLTTMPTELSTSAGKYAVVHPTSEVALRHVLWKAGGAPVLALLDEPLARRLPADLIRRARGGRVHAVEPGEVLSLALGVRVVADDDPAMQQLALQRVDDIRSQLGQRTLPTVVDRDLLDDLLLDVVAEGQLRKLSPGAVLAEWTRRPPAPEPAVTELLHRQLPRVHGLPGRVLSWALRKKDRLDALVVNGVLLALDEPELPESVWGPLVDGPRAIDLTPHTFRHIAADLARQALEALGDDAAHALARAGTIARKALTPSVLKRSEELPLGLENLCADTAQAVASGQEVGHDVIQRMRRHRFAAAHKADIDVLEEASRLSRYVAASRAPEGADVIARVRHYQRHGAFADWSAAELRSALAASATHARAAESALVCYRARRDEENRQFAEILQANYANALHREGVVPVHAIWRNAPLRQGDGDRAAVYLVVLDGCSYPVFLRLLSELASAFKPIGLRVSASTQEAHGTPALALLPTITSHSRGGIFAGEIPNNPWIAETVWRDTEEARTDPARFQQNEALGTRSRRLFLKGDLADHGAALLATLEDPGIEVVAAVFNAVDDQIGSANTGAAVVVKANQITALLPSFTAALHAGRRVVVVADHGHTPFVSRDLRTGDTPQGGGSARHRLLRPSDNVPAGFVEIDDGQLGGVRGRKAFAWKMGVYQGSPQVGFHGGCSLEEIVVPLAELVAGGVAADEPAWWFAGREAKAQASAAEPPPPEPTKAPPPARTPKVQGDLFDREPLLATDLDQLGMPPALRAKLDGSEQAALACVFRNQHARASDVARTLRRPVGRIDGLMSRLVGKLHGGGFPCLRRQTLPDGEQQYVYVRQGTERSGA
jgi:DNA-binding protein H-NS